MLGGQHHQRVSLDGADHARCNIVAVDQVDGDDEVRSLLGEPGPGLVEPRRRGGLAAGIPCRGGDVQQPHGETQPLRVLERGAEAWAPPRLQAKRADLSFAGAPTASEHPWVDDGIDLVATGSMPLISEVVLHHRESRSLVLADLAFHFQPDAPWLTRAVMFCALGYPGFRATTLERVLMKRSVAREELGQILEWDFDKIIVTHGEIVRDDGHRRLREATADL